MNALEDIKRCVVEGRYGEAPPLVKQALGELPPERILKEGLIAAMTDVGRLFAAGEYYIPEMLIAARAMKAGLDELRPVLVAANVQAVGKIVIGTVQGDLHDIGKNLVGMMMEGAGFEVIDLGVNVPPQKFVSAVLEYKPNLVGLSALLTTTMPNMKMTIEALNAANIRDGIKIIVGGAPVTEQFAREIGADLFAPDAASAASCAKVGITP